MSYVVIWTYDVACGCEAAFRAAYGPDGDWARLFAKARGFVGVELLGEGRRYATIDRWASQSAFDAFKVEHAGAYGALDAKLSPLTRAQQCVGAFHAMT